MQKIFNFILLINLFFINSYSFAKSLPLVNDRDYICSWAIATDLRTGQKFWDWEFDNGKFANYAIKKGWSCGVTSTINSSNLSRLGIEFHKENLYGRKSVQRALQVYGFYLGKIDGIWGRKTEAAINMYLSKIAPYTTSNPMTTIKFYSPSMYIKYIKKIGSSNNSNTNNETIKTCSDDPKLCTVTQLCSKATIFKNGKKTWSSLSYSKKYVEEANRNGLNCNVAVAEAKPKEVEVFNVASGTGFYVSNAGHLITNDHVITGCARVKVASKGKQIEALVLARDRQNDLAILKVNEKPKYVFSISKENPYPLQEIIVAGYPFGSLVSSSIKFTKGIVSSASGLGDNYSQIQIDAAIQPGNSGGPIVDDKGNAVAVAVAKLDLKKIYKDFGVVPENTNFGIKASAVRNLLEGNSVAMNEPKDEILKVNELSKNITDGTVHLSCWMTMAQIKEIKAKKVLFSEFE